MLVDCKECGKRANSSGLCPRCHAKSDYYEKNKHVPSKHILSFDRLDNLRRTKVDNQVAEIWETYNDELPTMSGNSIARMVSNTLLLDGTVYLEALGVLFVATPLELDKFVVHAKSYGESATCLVGKIRGHDLVICSA